ncbi:MAG: ABC transporter ATP-binding protein [Mycobacterium leprae]
MGAEAAQTSQPLVQVAQVTRTYQDANSGHPAVQEISLTVAPGEFVAIMGPSGCGKSTLLNLIGGIDRPDAGQITVCGKRVDQLSETALALFRRRHVGIVFQFFNLVGNLDVTDNIELPGLLAAMTAGQAKARAAELMDALRIGEVARKMPAQLSGGQRQRVAIARALMNRPALLLADEPTGALDQEAGQSVMRLFRQLHADGQSILMVTHDPRVSGHAERILLMEDGRVAEELRPGRVIASQMADAVRPTRLAERLLGSRG